MYILSYPTNEKQSLNTIINKSNKRKKKKKKINKYITIRLNTMKNKILSN